MVGKSLIKHWSVLILGIGAFWALTLVNINQPPTLNFDEFHYVPAAKAFLSSGPLVNFEHPPLGKVIISWGISLCGDNPLGWRLMSTIFGALTLGGLFCWAFQFFKSYSTAMFVIILAATNNLLFVQSRVAMLDTFMAAFLIWAFFLFSCWWKNRQHSALWGSGLFFGLALAIKWFALIPIGFAGLILIREFIKSRDKQYYFLITAFSLIILLIYFLSFLPVALHNGYSYSEFFHWQYEIWSGQLRVPDAHPYRSSWWSWPLQLRPMWYHFTSKDYNMFEGVALIGNPIILWSGLLSVVFLLCTAMKKRSLKGMEFFFAYLVLFLSWPLVPRKIMFFYYYYPAALILALTLAQGFELLRLRLGRYFEVSRLLFALSSVACFIHYYPILSAGVADFGRIKSWAWFSSWI